MTYRQFKYLSETDQELICWSKGVEIASKADQIYQYKLYQVDGFYMEVQSTIAFRIIRKISSFNDRQLLESYLEQIKIVNNY